MREVRVSFWPVQVDCADELLVASVVGGSRRVGVMRRAGQTRRAEKCEASAMGSKELQHFLYPLNPDSGYYLESHGQQFKTSLVGFADYLNRSDGEPSEWRLHANHRKIGPGDMVWAYFTSPTSAIGAAGYVLDWPHWNADWDSWAISIGWDNKLTEKLRKSPIPYRSFEQRVLFSAVRANTTTRRVLEDFLRGTLKHRDRERLETRRKVQRSVSIRIGQPQFRADLLHAYGGRCAISGCAEPFALEAAHIVPVAAGGTHNVNNGLLLRADLHSLFDWGKITVTDDLRVHIHHTVTDVEYRQLHGRELNRPLHRSQAPLKKNVREHRQLWD